MNTTVESILIEIARLGEMRISNRGEYQDVTAALADLALRLARAVST